jgi:hypothetical protein
MGANVLLNYRIVCGFLVFGICAAIGLRFLYRGVRDDICDGSGTPIAGCGWFIVGGIFCLLPLVAYSLFFWRQGYFGSGGMSTTQPNSVAMSAR